MMTPFWSVHHRQPEMQFSAPKAPTNLKPEIQADAVLECLEETHRLQRDSILHAQERQTKYAGGKEITFEVGYRVWLSTKHYRTTRHSKKVDNKRAGPYMISRNTTPKAYKFDLSMTMRNHNVFRASQLARYPPPVVDEQPSEPLPPIGNELGEE
jgi:hypothetical protein